jgi:hypothetical protein
MTASIKVQNPLFNCIPNHERDRLLPYVEKIEMPLGMSMIEPGMKLSHAYFPATAIVSILHELENGTSAEVAAVGNEGLVGISIFWVGAPLAVPVQSKVPVTVIVLKPRFY